MTEKKKIIHIIQSLGNGGCENMLLRMLPLLNAFEHTIITLKEPGELAPKFATAGITVKTIPWIQLRKKVIKESPDIIITYLFHADMIGRLLLSHCHSELVEESHLKKIPIIPFLRTTYNHPKYLVARILEWVTRPLVNRYLANSEAVKDFYVKRIGVSSEKITTIPNGIDIEYFDSITPNPDLRKSLSIAPSDFVIICVANLHINKGHRYLLEAFEQFHHSSSPPFQGGELKRELKLLLVGDGNEKESLLHQIENYQSKENILLLGQRTDVPQLLKISNLFVLPTLFEGMSNAIMEAMASGLPVITTDIPENRSLIENNISGILIPTQDSEALSQTIQQIQGNPSLSASLSQKAKIAIQNSFSLEEIAKKWENTLMEIIK
ncbi:MAG: glycosyltransferase [Candidatus Moraniibacteriota bacterium]